MFFFNFEDCMQSLYDYCFEPASSYNLYYIASITNAVAKLAVELAAMLCLLAVGFVLTVLAAAVGWFSWGGLVALFGFV